MFLCSTSAEKRFEMSKFSKDVSEKDENWHIWLTCCVLSRGIFGFQSQKFSATELGGDLMHHPLKYKRYLSSFQQTEAMCFGVFARRPFRFLITFPLAKNLRNRKIVFHRLFWHVISIYLNLLLSTTHLVFVTKQVLLASFGVNCC